MQIHRSSFDKGLDTNLSKNLIPPNKYVEANNINIASTGNFFAVENIKGSVAMASIIPSAVGSNIAGIFANRFKVGTVENVDGLTIFSYTSTTFTIWAFAGDLYKMYEETITSAYANAKPLINAISYPEAGLDILYFTDNENELRKVRCEIPSSSLATPSTAFLTAMDLKLLRHGGNGKVELDSILTNGSLFCGSYQFAYQLVNVENNQFTKFSLLSNPIQIYLNNRTDAPKSGVGLQSSSAIKLTITPSEEELDHYTHFRLAVVENIEPSGVVVTKAWLTKLEEISSYLSGSALANVLYQANSRLESIDLTDIVVDKLAIDTVKTITVRDNRLVGGNVTYKDLSLDNGDPVVGGGSIIKQTGGSTYENLFYDSELSSKHRGYFRDEVYRFAISYFDEDGNFSYPKVLDLSAVTHNQISGAYNDMKFPDRSQYLDGTNYTLFNSNGGIQSLGLQLTGIDNHPTWAKGFVILRAERIKNILFQTPIVPLLRHEAIGAVEQYPYIAKEASGTTTKDVEYATAQPMGPFTTYFPRNYFFPRLRSIYTYDYTTNGAAPSIQYLGEAYYAFPASHLSGMIFPPSFLYENKSFVFNPTFELETVDAAIVKGKYSNFSSLNVGSTDLGKNIRTSVAGTFHALLDTQYYYDSAHTGAKASIADSKVITDYSEFDNLDSPDVVGGRNFFNHNKFVTEGLHWSTVGNVNKCGVAVFRQYVSEINSDGLLTFTAGSQVAHSGDTTFYTTDDTLIHTIEIANMVAGLQDTRYGAYDTPHDFISTGTIYTFSNTELTSVEAGTTLPITVDVWGGDCYVSPHFFKLTDTVYGVTNQGKHDGTGGEATLLDAVESWERAFADDNAATACSVSVPVPFKNAAQYLQIVLESEYNPSVPDTQMLDELTTVGSETINMTVFGAGSEDKCRVPLNYELNPNHKKPNNDKIFRIKDPLLVEVDNLAARLIYSDQKVYQTSVTGFDTFRVLNFYDLQEGYGEIYRLEVLGDQMYAFQRKAVTYIGVGERALETTDALTLAVQSGNFIGNVIPVNTFTGTQHIGSVVNTGRAIYFIDNEKQSFNRLADKQIVNLSEESIYSSLKDGLEGRRFNNELFSIYDPIHKQVWFVHNGSGGASPFCYVYDEARGMWVANYEFAQSALLGGAYSGGFLYIIGNNASSNISVEQMYEGQRTILLGTTVTPNVKFVVNPSMELSKTFDDILIPANDRLATLDFTVVREASLGDQTASGITLDVDTRGEGNYRAKILRDSDNARLRGLYGIGNIKWATGSGEIAVAVPSVLTKYRLSESKF